MFHWIKCLVSGLLFLFSLPLFLLADIPCPACGFQNQPDDRYCLECAAEIRAVTPEEMKRFQQIQKDKKYEQKRTLRRKRVTQNKVKTINKDGASVDLTSHAVKGQVTIFDFYADWCGPCKSLEPKLKAFVNETEGVVLRQIDIKTWSSPVAKKYKINSIPAIWIYDKHKKRIAKLGNNLQIIKKEVTRALSK